MFKRTLLGAAIASVAFAGTSNAAIDLAGEKVQLFGLAWGGVNYKDVTTTSETTAGVGAQSSDVETLAGDQGGRLGFKGTVEFDQVEPDFIYEIASNFATEGNEQRDTWIGFTFDEVGKVRFGRVLAAGFEVVDDVAGGNSGSGNAGADLKHVEANDADLANDVGIVNFDRVSNAIRFDSVDYNGFSFAASYHNGNSDTEQSTLGFYGKFANDTFALRAGHLTQDGYTVDGVRRFDNSQTDFSASLYLGSLTIEGAVTSADLDGADGQADDSQRGALVHARYNFDNGWYVRAGYGKRGVSDTVETLGLDDSDVSMGFRVGTNYNGVDLFWDVKHNEERSLINNQTITVVETQSVGFNVEYAF